MILMAAFVAAFFLAASGGKAEVGVWAVYFIGQMIHTFLKANVVAAGRRKAGQAYTAMQYWRDNRWEIIARKFLGACAFLFIWDNPHVVNLTSEGSKIGFRTLLAAAGIVGYFSDSLLEKITPKIMAKLGLGDASARVPQDKS